MGHNGAVTYGNLFIFADRAVGSAPRLRPQKTDFLDLLFGATFSHPRHEHHRTPGSVAMPKSAVLRLISFASPLCAHSGSLHTFCTDGQRLIAER